MHSYLIEICDDKKQALHSTLGPDDMCESDYQYVDYFHDVSLDWEERKEIINRLASLLNVKVTRGSLSITSETYTSFFEAGIDHVKTMLSQETNHLDNVETVSGWLYDFHRAENYMFCHDEDLLIYHRGRVCRPGDFLRWDFNYGTNDPNVVYIGSILGYHW